MYLFYRKNSIDLMPIVNAVFLLTGIFFISLLIFFANPFKKLDEGLIDGVGLNPLLQDPYMIFHPPALYLGFIGFSIPFACAIASLISGNSDIILIKMMKKWSLIAWFFLTLGIVLGSKWAYIELGWGGYWGWDPIENASLIPWFTSTAYIHSIIVEERKNMLRHWNLILIILTFWLCILGTFLTRSGIISSVHAFAESTIGDFFIIYLSFIFLFSCALIYLNWGKIHSKQRIESIISKESSFIVNNVIFVVMALVVLWGTTLPIFSELFIGKQYTVSNKFYVKALLPFSIILLLLTAVCLFLGWGITNLKKLMGMNMLMPLFVSIIIIIIMLLMGIKSLKSLILIFSCVFLFVTIAIEIINSLRAQFRFKQRKLSIAFFALLLKSRRRYIVYIAHLSIAMIFIGLAGANFNSQKEVILSQGSIINFNGYEIKYLSMKTETLETKTSVIAELEAKRSGNKIIKLYPSKDFYNSWKEPMTEVDIYSTLEGDLYAVLMGWEENGQAYFQFIYNPLINWLWYGCWLLIFSTFLLLLPDRLDKILVK